MVKRVDDNDVVTKGSCDKKHVFWVWFTGLVLPIIAVAITWSLTTSNQAWVASETVAEELHVHIAAQEEHEKHMAQSLHRIETGLNEILKETRGN